MKYHIFVVVVSDVNFKMKNISMNEQPSIRSGDYA